MHASECVTVLVSLQSILSSPPAACPAHQLALPPACLGHHHHAVAACSNITGGASSGYQDVSGSVAPSNISASVQAAFLVWYSTVETVRL